MGGMGGMGGAGRSRARQTVRGTDVQSNISLTFLEGCKGTTKTVNVTRIVDCVTCDASGLKKGIQRKTCNSCGGSGTRTFVVDGGFQMASTCQTCQGEGSTVPSGGECTSCGGVGKVRSSSPQTIKVPAGASFRDHWLVNSQILITQCRRRRWHGHSSIPGWRRAPSGQGHQW